MTMVGMFVVNVDAVTQIMEKGLRAANVVKVFSQIVAACTANNGKVFMTSQISKKQSSELLLTHCALIQIRNLAKQLLVGNVSQEDQAIAAKRIHALADAFHEVPGVIASGKELDVKTFRAVMNEIGFTVPDEYPSATACHLRQ